MTGLNLHGRAWSLGATQHGVVSHAQLRELGLSRHAIAHRVERGRLHRVFRGVYAVGRPELTRHGRWMAAVLGSGSGACLSHCSAAALWGLSTRPQDYVDVSIPASTVRRLPGITTQRRVPSLLDDAVLRDGIPVTSLVTTLSDLMLIWTRDEVEAAINAADRLGLTDPVALRESLEGRRPWP